MRITAAVMQKADGTLTRRKIALEQVELDRPRDDEVLVRISSAGVCGTDRGCIHGLEPYPTPGVLGHEGVLLQGKRIVGVMGGGGQTPDFLESLMELQRQGRFPLEKLVRFYAFDQINQAIDDSDAGVTVKPVLRMR